MNTIQENLENQIIIQKSSFITFLYKINHKKEIQQYLEEIRKRYCDATHYCYAYRLSGYEKCSDDGEPQGTAGAPILHVLQMKQLHNILCIVVRYFGGIKLGAGGLVRAYTKCVTECLKKGSIIPVIEGYRIQLTIKHSSIKQIDYLLKDYPIIKKYDSDITYEFSISKKEFEKMKNSLVSLVIDYQILENIYI